MPSTLILRSTDLRPGRILTVEIDGETLTGITLATGTNESGVHVAFVRWEDGSMGRVTDGFLMEASRVSIGGFNGG